MNDIGMHAPTPEFRDALEEEVVRALHRDEKLAPAARVRRAARWPIVAALAAGLILGVGTGFASGQVRDAQQRDELTSAMTAKRELAGLRLNLARLAYDIARRKAEAGSAPQSDVASTQAALAAAEAEVARVDLDLQEIKLTAAPPRDELWAPLVGRRDFVTERLSAGAIAVQQQLAQSESALADATRAIRVGTTSTVAFAEAESNAAQARRDRDMLAQKLALRKQALEEHLAAEEVGRRLQVLEVTSEVALLNEQLKIAQDRLTITKQRYTLGAGPSDLDVKKAEVDVMQMQLELAKLQVQLRSLGRGRGGG